MQETVVSEFPASRILIPRQVRGDYETLTEAINIASSLPGGPEDNPSPSYADDGGADGDGSGSSRSSGGAEGELKGGWPLVDDTRGMVLFIIDYQSTNVHCRPAVREVGNGPNSCRGDYCWTFLFILVCLLETIHIKLTCIPGLYFAAAVFFVLEGLFLFIFLFCYPKNERRSSSRANGACDLVLTAGIIISRILKRQLLLSTPFRGRSSVVRSSLFLGWG